jgi:DNA-binding CsgD family transcriptional regulator
MGALAERAARLAPPDDPRARCLAAIAQGAALVLRGEAEAEERLREAAELIEATPALREDVRVAALLGVPAAFTRGGPEQYAPLERAVARARESGAVGVLPYALFYLGVGAMAGPRWREAAAHFEEAIRLGGETGLRVDAVSALAGLARLKARRGDEAAGPDAATALRLAREFGMPFFEAWALHAQGDRAWAREDVGAALAAFEAKAAVLERHTIRVPDLSPAPERVAALVRLGREPEARALAAAALTEAHATGRPWALARAHRAQALAAQDDGAALAAFDLALALHERAGDPFEHARTRLDLGERLRRGGRRADAREPLRAALETFAGLGAAPWADRAAAELEATGETARRRDASTLDDLTPQELRIALMLARGATTRQAAAALYLSPKTVEYHLRHVYLKLGVNTRTALAEALAPAPELPTAGLPAPG